MIKGDIVLITFPFTDLSGSKLRPAVVLFHTTLDTTVCFISSQIGNKANTNIELEPDPQNGLKKQSLLITSKIATLEKSLIKGLLGKLSTSDINKLDSKLLELLGLNK